jgi:hypothetical protein
LSTYWNTELFDFFWTLPIVSYMDVLQKTTTFRRLDLSPSSGGWGRIDLLSWGRQKELASITELESSFWRAQLSRSTLPIHLRTETDPVSETLWSFVKRPNKRRWTESKRSQIVLYNTHHRQNPFKSIYWNTVSLWRHSNKERFKDNFVLLSFSFIEIKWAHKVTLQSVCVCVCVCVCVFPRSTSELPNDFQETLYGRYETRGDSNTVLSNHLK